MGSRKEEERNEKIIRGLMKLPPNRRCINCNSLGPQYVCTNFWTFVCLTCSGIHREFTHRVKSVSMSKFTSQEVEALQNGGNQRAREIYLRDWDQQRQRLPDNSNPDKVRDFIKTVYVDKTYAGGKTHDKPPRDLQRIRSHEDETRRASSYHSYSQSPPYDFQYEDRRYGKQAAALTRKPGSDRGLYVGKMSSFICSPTRLNERMFEDRFANEGSVSRVLDYSMSSGGDLVNAESPNFQKDVGYGSPPVQTRRDFFGEDAQHQRLDQFSEANLKKGAEGILRPQRTTSLGSIGSFYSNSVSLKSHNLGSLLEVSSGPEQAITGADHDGMPTFAQLSAPASSGSLDLFKAPFIPESDACAASSIDLFQLPETSAASSISLFEASPLNPAPSMNAYQTTQTSLPSSLDLFDGISPQQPVTSLDQNSLESSAPKNEGWATFDTQPTASTPGTGSLTASVMPSSVDPSAKFDQVSSLDTSMNWLPFQNSGGQGSSSVPDPWNNGFHDVQAPGNTSSAQTWNAFGNSITHLPLEASNKSSEPQVAAHVPSTADQHFVKVSEDFSKDGIDRAGTHEGLSSLKPSYTPVNPMMEATQSHATTNHKSTNPFDLPYDSDLDPDNMFLDMSSLQVVLPNAHLPSTFLGSVTETWFPQDPVTAYIPAATQGGLVYMAGQAPGPQLANVQTQGSVASVGGNPFA